MCITFSTESFKIIMATVLCIFVPQKCGDHICTMSENVTNLTDYNIFVLAFNFFTMFYFIILYVREIRRERWMITHLEYDKNHNEYNLQTFAEKYPRIMERLKKHNQLYFTTYVYLRYLYFLNIVFSAVLLFYFYYLDYRTTTTFVTNIILCWAKVFKGYFMARRSMKENIALSYYNTQFISFNSIDPDYVVASCGSSSAAADESSGEEFLFGICGGGCGGGRRVRFSICSNESNSDCVPPPSITSSPAGSTA